eukprot:TRINITY_DN923_c0_g3_i5.p1 TRINITY_DN923_c0_g3~~TRINITY_DN923_c0_g3_i5.p1  ORF type:complete len:235 (+),score=42.70 TRINITY_DN923_c0_g3_i5:90-707(+)
MNRKKRSEGALQRVGTTTTATTTTSSQEALGRTSSSRLRSTSARFKEAAADEDFRKEVQLARLNALEFDNFSNANEQLNSQVEDDEYVEEGLEVNDDDEVVYPGRKRRKKKQSTQPDHKRLSGSSNLRRNKLVINLNKILEAMSSIDSTIDYLKVAAAPSKYPPRSFCSTCGYPAAYRCVECGSRFCSIKCNEVHKEFRCLKWTA